MDPVTAEFYGHCPSYELCQLGPRHDWTIGLWLHGGPRMDSYLTDWAKRYVICRRCEKVIENDGTPAFAVDWARTLLKIELE